MDREPFERRLRARLSAIAESDRELRDELGDVRGSGERHAEARELEAALPYRAARESAAAPDLAMETIVLRVGRPVLRILHDQAELQFRDAQSEVWRDRLRRARTALAAAARAVGRVEVQGHAMDWLGTAWLVAPNLVVTNRHVAREFGQASGSRFVFRRGLQGRAMTADVDFLEEFGRDESLAFHVRAIRHIEGDDGPDLAFLEVAPMDGRPLATPLQLANRDGARGEQVAVIGYPARDSRIPEVDLMDRIFGNVFDKKRLAPGQVMRIADGSLLHDCSTLGGNSGSAVISLGSGDAIGLHFAGRFLEANFAVPSRIVAQRLAAIKRGESITGPVSTRDYGGDDGNTYVQAGSGTYDAPCAGSTTVGTVTFPVHVTVGVGSLQFGCGCGGGGTGGGGTGTSGGNSGDADGDYGYDDGDGREEVFTEAVPEDYDDREGYQPDFLGDGFVVPLPRMGQSRRPDVLTYERDGKREGELRYEHFSVVMSRSRRLCFFSAVNIDGRQSRKLPRSGWRTDPRIPQDAQILHECYGNPPKFSRGHMTRREDPVWGDTAERGNDDSMHVTNTVPQMQVFNAGIWLGLENYALDNARKDQMRICVITGPYLRDDDPERFGVRVPVRFWKVIAFIHDQTRKLTATGYTLSQKDVLPRESVRADEFVYGGYKTAQVPVASIEAETGLSFGPLKSVDPLRHATEAVAGDLLDPSQIRFI